MRFVVLLLSLFWFSDVGAQVFETGSGIGKNGKSTEQSTLNNVTLKDTSDKINEAGKTQNSLTRAQVNLNDGTKEEKKYDNSVGKVVEFKVVNGKIEFKDSDERKILVYTENYRAEKGIDGIVRCSLRVYVLNDMHESLNNLSFKMIWPEISTSVQMVKVNPGVRTYSDITLLGNGCFSMDKTPTIEVNRCRVKGKTQEECANAVHWFPKK